MKTKQEIVSFLESKVGTKVICVGNPSLDGQCVTLIKSLMEFLGVPDPYKARGHAKTCVSAYLAEGIAKTGLGFLSVFSNKDMASGYGHIWCNAGEGDGIYYESNGAKPLLVTKGKHYTHDAVCNFDSYIQQGGDMSEIDDLKKRVADLEKEVSEKNTQIGNYVKQVEGLDKALKECRASTPAVDPSQWEQNGLTIEVIEGSKKTTTNYKRKV